MSVYQSEQALCLDFHHSADPAAHAKALAAKPLMSDAAYQREYELSFASGGGDLIFSEILDEYKDEIIVEPFAIPESWPRWLGLDWGWAVESAIVERAFDPIEQMGYVTWEFYEPGVYLENLAGIIITLDSYQSKNFRGVLADPSLFRVTLPISSKSKLPRGVAETLIDYGVKFLQKANIGQAECLQRILGMWTSIDEHGPSLKIFNTCENLLSELRTLRRDEKNPGKADDSLPNHAYQALGYSESVGRQLIDMRIEPFPFKLTTDDPNSVAYWWRKWQQDQKKPAPNKLWNMRRLILERRKEASKRRTGK